MFLRISCYSCLILVSKVFDKLFRNRLMTQMHICDYSITKQYTTPCCDLEVTIDISSQTFSDMRT